MPDTQDPKRARPTARDLMQTDVVTLPAGTTISQAVQAFEEYHITGAPVTDASGRPIGVLSLADIARDDSVRAGRLECDRWEYYLANPLNDDDGDRFSGENAIFDKEDFSAAVLDDQRVEDWMTPRVISVDPTLPLVELCKVMTEQSIHRVLVTEEDTVLGIVSTTDVVRYIAEHGHTWC